MTRATMPAPTDFSERERLRWKIGAWVGGLLTAGPVMATIVTAIGMLHSHSIIESERAPTPGDLSIGVYISLIGTAVGMLACLAGTALLVVSLLKLHRIDRGAEGSRTERYST